MLGIVKGEINNISVCGEGHFRNTPEGHNVYSEKTVLHKLKTCCNRLPLMWAP